MNNEALLISGIIAQAGSKAASSALRMVDPGWLVMEPARVSFQGLEALDHRGIPTTLDALKSAVRLTHDEVDWLETITNTGHGAMVGLEELVQSIRLDDANRRAKTILGAFLAKESLSQDDMANAARELSAIGSNLQPTQFEVICGSASIDKLEVGDALLPLEKRCNLIKFGIPALDNTVRCPSGSLGVIAAITSAGKTTIALQAAAKTAFDGRSTLFVSLEMSHEEIHAKLIGHMIKADSFKLISNNSWMEFEPIVKDAVSRFHSLCPGSGTNWLPLEAKIRELHESIGFSVVFIDYFTLLEPPDFRRGANSAQMYGEISKSAKRLAQNLDICIVLVSQFNRNPEECEEPRLKDLRETGQLENDASWALLLWNTKEVVRNGNPIVKCRTAKNRGGPRWGLTTLEADRVTGNFYGLET